MVSVDEAVICRLKKAGSNFEILVDPYKAEEFKKTKQGNLEEIVAVKNIYRDARKGDLVSMEELQKGLMTTKIDEAIKKILMEGEIQITTEQRRRMIEEKKMQIADLIAKRAINPQTNLPHPPNRIINAMEQAGVQIDPFADAESQVDKVIKSIKSLLPIKMQRVVIQLTVPPQFAGKLHSSVRRIIPEFEEKWQNDGSLQIIANIPAGLQVELLKLVGDATHGNFKADILRREDV
ncbi:MAG: ribosome assembly factor SBDS [Candidatus Aenigmarchaeota archaeon]|nr:ribosome assembly factor SBDS [Candidatus Aenigmarchaeota archaeon]MCX8179219.1 ribosome assembly factor SBDS [Candidatus Aenigmarchaeota archaeon]